MNEIKEYNETIFESIKHIDEYGNEYWLARELQNVLEYKRWDKFCNVINNAQKACENSNYKVFEHFSQVGKTSKMPNGGVKNLLDYKLSRYACYLIVQNSDPRKEVVALGQTYFAVQTRRQELTEKEYSMLTEDEKRFYQRSLTKKGNYSLNQAAKKAGVKNFDQFHNAGYKGLYNGETADDIAKRKGLRYREDILDNMGIDKMPVLAIEVDGYFFHNSEKQECRDQKKDNILKKCNIPLLRFKTNECNEIDRITKKNR